MARPGRLKNNPVRWSKTVRSIRPSVQDSSADSPLSVVLVTSVPCYYLPNINDELHSAVPRGEERLRSARHDIVLPRLLTLIRHK